MDIFKGRITVVEVDRRHDLNVSEFEGWNDEPQRSMEKGVRDHHKDLHEQSGEVQLQIYTLESGAA